LRPYQFGVSLLVAIEHRTTTFDLRHQRLDRPPWAGSAIADD
jgi:hypothetical protein